MKAVFMGTPEIAAVILDAAAQMEIEILAVVTQPDRPKGRRGETACPEVKRVALKHGFPVLQPERVKEKWFLDEMKNLRPDVILVAAFGQLLPKSLLEIPQYGCINVHASLLPRYRGASPIQWAVINGDAVTGITIMYMEKGIDTGDILLQKEIAVSAKETGGSLSDKLARLGADCLKEVLVQIQEGTVSRVRQDESRAVYVGILNKSDGLLDFSLPADVLERRIRGLNPWPSAFTYWKGKLLKIWESEFIACTTEQDCGNAAPGTAVRIEKDSIYVQTGQGLLKLCSVQLEGKKRMSCKDFLRGCQVGEGDRFG